MAARPLKWPRNRAFWMWLTSAVLLLLLFSLPFWVDRSCRRAKRKLSHQLQKKDILHAVTFDEAEHTAWASKAKIVTPGATRIRTASGHALKLNGRDDSSAHLHAPWSGLGTAYTIGVRVNITGEAREQDILYSGGLGAETGLRLEGNEIAFYVPTKPPTRLTCPFPGRNLFIHLVGVVNAEAGTATLYCNGQPQQSLPIGEIRLPEQHIAWGNRSWLATRNPLKGIVDDTLIFKRPLTEADVKKWARGAQNSIRVFAPSGAYFRWRFFHFLTRIGNVMRINSLRPLPLPYAHQDMDGLHLIMPRGSHRELRTAHQRSLLAGRRTRGAARQRPIHLSQKGTVYPATLSLFGTDVSYDAGTRPAYLVEWTEPQEDGTAKNHRWRLTPPEADQAYLRPLARAIVQKHLGLPHIETRLFPLYINGRFRGMYLLQDWAKEGLLPGEREDVYRMPRILPASWELFFRESVDVESAPYPLSRDELYKELAPEWEQACKQLFKDPLFPSSRRKLRKTLKKQWQAILQTWAFDSERYAPLPSLEKARLAAAAKQITSYAVLGDNPSPWHLVSPLVLSSLHFPSLNITWHSDTPEWLDDKGGITRPTNGSPVRAQLHARLICGSQEQTEVLSFRVMPEQINMPALFIHTRDAINKIYRVDAQVAYRQNGEDMPSTHWMASQAHNAGISFRGNSSFWKPKRLFSLKTDVPHGLFSTNSASRMILGLTGLQDPLYIRNRLANHWFRTWGESREGMTVAPELIPAEVYVNGTYQGIFELGTRIDEHLLSGPGTAEPPKDKWIVYRHETVRPRHHVRISRPPPDEWTGENLLTPYLSLTEALEQPQNASELQDMLDLPNWLDAHLLLNLTQNLNGFPLTTGIMEAAVYDRQIKRFFCVPWDSDYTFLPDDWRQIDDQLFAVIHRELPQVKPLLQTRWHALRNGPLRDELWRQDCTRLFQAVQDFLPDDIALWREPQFSVEKAFSDFCIAVSRNFERLDALYGTQATENRVSP